MIGKIGILLVVAVSLFGSYSAQGIGVGESKTEACANALEKAKKEAMEQAGTYISSKYSSRVAIENKKMLSNKVSEIYQSSAGFAKLLNKKEISVDVDQKTFMFTCQLEAEFDFDLSKLESEVEAALVQQEREKKYAQREMDILKEIEGYENSYREMSAKYNKVHTVAIDQTTTCLLDTSVRQCQESADKKIVDGYKKRLAIENGIDSSFISVKLQSFDGTPQPVFNKDFYTLNLRGNAYLSVMIANPYENQIAELRTRLKHNSSTMTVQPATEPAPVKQTESYTPQQPSSHPLSTLYIGYATFSGSGTTTESLVSSENGSTYADTDYDTTMSGSMLKFGWGKLNGSRFELYYATQTNTMSLPGWSHDLKGQELGLNWIIPMGTYSTQNQVNMLPFVKLGLGLPMYDFSSLDYSDSYDSTYSGYSTTVTYGNSYKQTTGASFHLGMGLLLMLNKNIELAANYELVSTSIVYESTYMEDECYDYYSDCVYNYSNTNTYSLTGQESQINLGLNFHF